jgi:hypothetical protein
MTWTIEMVGAVCFGLVVGWITYRTLARKESATSLTDIASVIGAVGGAAITALFKSEALFGAYSVGLAIGFFAYLALYWLCFGKTAAGKIMGD